MSKKEIAFSPYQMWILYGFAINFRLEKFNDRMFAFVKGKYKTRVNINALMALERAGLVYKTGDGLYFPSSDGLGIGQQYRKQRKPHASRVQEQTV